MIHGNVNKLIQSENTYLRQIGWFAYDRMENGIFSVDEIDQLLSMFLQMNTESILDEEFKHGYEEGYKYGYKKGYNDSDDGYQYCDYVEWM